jgi:hypothetical protein
MVVALDGSDVEAGSVGWEDTMGCLKVVDYRYTRSSSKAQWRMVRYVLEALTSGRRSD